jgi:hypothetical protein
MTGTSSFRTIRARLALLLLVVLAGLFAIVGVQFVTGLKVSAGIERSNSLHEARAALTDAAGALQEIHVLLLEIWSISDATERAERFRIVRANVDYLKTGYGSTISDPAAANIFKSATDDFQQRISEIATQLSQTGGLNKNELVNRIRQAAKGLYDFSSDQSSTLASRMK